MTVHHPTGVLSLLAASSAAARDAILSSKPSILPLLTGKLIAGTPSCTAFCVGALSHLHAITMKISVFLQPVAKDLLDFTALYCMGA